MLKNNPLVTIVLPCYNGADFLSCAIESCIAQTFTDWELIIVNDCSVDNSMEIAQHYAEKDSRIRVLNNEKNLKLPASLNKGFRSANGKYYTWTSHDNVMLPTMLDDFVAYLDANPNVGMVISDYQIIDENNSVVKTALIMQDVNLQMPLNNYVGCSFMYRRSVAEIIGEYNENMFLIEDYDYWIRIWRKFPIGKINKVLYSYRIHGQSLTSLYRPKVAEKLIELRLLYFNDFNESLQLHPKLLCIFYTRIVDALRGSEKWKYFKRFSVLYPVRFGCKYFFVHLPKQLIRKH